jgi:hypothetical protein
MTAANEKPDLHRVLADKLAITRKAAKELSFAVTYGIKPLFVSRAHDDDLIRCHAVAALWFQPWGAAKAARWAELTCDKPMTIGASLTFIQHHLPLPGHLRAKHPLEPIMQPRARLVMAHRLTGQTDSEAVFAKIEEVLRPLVFIVNNQGPIQ